MTLNCHRTIFCQNAPMCVGTYWNTINVTGFWKRAPSLPASSCTNILNIRRNVPTILVFSMYNCTYLKVSKFRNVFWCLQFLPKNERKHVDLRFHSSKVEFICSFFGRNIGLKKSFRLCLTFTYLKHTCCYIYVMSCSLHVCIAHGIVCNGDKTFLKLGFHRS